MIYFTSDTHWSHFRIIEYCNRPFIDVHEMNKQLTENWNSRVSDNDIVFHLGDFAFCKGESLAAIISGLKGNIIISVGNHDKKKRLLEAGIKFAYNEIYIKVDNNVFWLSHFPLENRQGDNRYFRPQPRMPHTYALHGHRHSTPDRRLNKELKALDVGVDCQGNYSPWSLDEIIEEFNS